VCVFGRFEVSIPNVYEQARQVFRDHGGILRTREALAAGIHRRTLYELRDAGELDHLARGVHRLAEMPPLSDPDLTTVGKRVPKGVVCLISALAFHELTTQIPHVVHLALPRNARTPKLESAAAGLSILRTGIQRRRRTAQDRGS
jgi:predicted transcriptional regulator of viral defense system